MRQTHVFSNNSGFTLVELLVAIVILVVGLLGLMQTVNYALVKNLDSQLRQEAVYIADEVMSMEKSIPFDQIPVTPTLGEPLQRNYSRTVTNRIVNGSSREFSVVRSNAMQTDQSINIDVAVSWLNKGQQASHSISSLVTRNQ